MGMNGDERTSMDGRGRTDVDGRQTKRWQTLNETVINIRQNGNGMTIDVEWNDVTATMTNCNNVVE
jgi:hypothetical protein